MQKSVELDNKLDQEENFGTLKEQFNETFTVIFTYLFLYLHLIYHA